jgi:D-3-phosphoglycerate dehydrogenase
MSTKRILVAGELAPEVVASLETDALEVDVVREPTEAELARRIAGYHGLIVGPAVAVAAEALRAAGDLEVIGCTGADTGSVDVDAATRRGIVVATTPESNTLAAAEQALALVLACARDLVGINADLHAGRWTPGAWAQAGVEVRGRTLGIAGLRGVAPLLAETAFALGMKIVACDPTGLADAGAGLSTATIDEPGRVYAEADFVVVDLPDDPPTGGFIGAAEFAVMKDGVRLISLSRPGVVDSEAWAAAIAAGKVAASAATVYAGGPPAGGAGPAGEASPAFGALGLPESVLLVPHLEESTVDARLRAGLTVAEQVAAVLRGEFASNAVNVPVELVDDADELMPYLGLCSQLGRLLVSLAGGPVDDLEISSGGSFAYFDTRILTLSLLGGVLAGRVGGPVNYVNAQAIANEHALTVRESKHSDVLDFPRLVTVSTVGRDGPVSVSGTSLGPAHKPRLVEVFGDAIDISPAPRMVFLRYADLPGVGGKLGTMLGEWGVNIGNMSVGRGATPNRAVMALTLDQPLTEEQLRRLIEHCGIDSGVSVEL